MKKQDIVYKVLFVTFTCIKNDIQCTTNNDILNNSGLFHFFGTFFDWDLTTNKQWKINKMATKCENERIWTLKSSFLHGAPTFNNLFQWLPLFSTVSLKRTHYGWVSDYNSVFYLLLNSFLKKYVPQLIDKILLKIIPCQVDVWSLGTWGSWSCAPLLFM